MLYRTSAGRQRLRQSEVCARFELPKLVPSTRSEKRNARVTSGVPFLPRTAHPYSDVYAPIRELADRGGYAILMGVGLEAMTALHLAEQAAGRRLFRRWANGPDGEAMDVSVGGCSRGFSALDAVLSTVERTQRVGNGLCRAFPLREVLALASAAIASRPGVTRCTRSDCVRCADAVAGGPFSRCAIAGPARA